MAYDLLLFSYLNAIAGRADAIDWLIVFLAVGFAYVVVTLVGLVLLLSKKRPRKERLVVFLLALGSATFARFGITGVIWRFYERPRPFLSHEVNQLLFVDAPSFPSGHSTFMFAFSTVVYLYDRKIGVILYACSILIVLSRIAASVHYPSDILGGFVIGTLTGYLAYRFIGMRALNGKSAE